MLWWCRIYILLVIWKLNHGLLLFYTLRRVRPSESLFLDALSLDPPNEAEVPPSSRLESEKRFPCLNEVRHDHRTLLGGSVMNLFVCVYTVCECTCLCVLQALNEISERADPVLYPEEEMTSGSLLRYLESVNECLCVYLAATFI